MQSVLKVKITMPREWETYFFWGGMGISSKGQNIDIPHKGKYEVNVIVKYVQKKVKENNIYEE
jgi:hypothetical protein